MLLPMADEDFVDVEGVAIAYMLSLQPLGIFCAKLDAPPANRCVIDGDSTFSQ